MSGSNRRVLSQTTSLLASGGPERGTSLRIVIYARYSDDTLPANRPARSRTN